MPRKLIHNLGNNLGSAEFFCERRDWSIRRVGGEANRQRHLQPPDGHDDWYDNLHQHGEWFSPTQAAVDDMRVSNGADHGQSA